jgi:hypothetical protein
MSDIETAYKTIAAKRPDLDTLYLYYNGPQPLKYSTQRLREAFDKITVHFDVNWCTVVVDTVLDRLGLTGFDTKDKTINGRLDELFALIHLDIEAMEAHRAALSMECGYLILWKTDNEIEAYYNDPRLCHVFYDAARPKVKTFAAKWFTNADGNQEITLYYTNRIEHWSTRRKSPSSAKDFTLASTEANPYGVIPVFELKSEGEISKITSLQDAINMTMANMMVSGEFSAAPQKWAISQSDPGELKNGAGIIWWFPTGDGQGQGASVGQFTATPLTPFLDAMDKLANYIAIITRTPKHYFMTTGANISGEALLAMESPLVKKVKNRQKLFGAVWQDIAAFMLLLDGQNINPDDITVVWERAESIQPLTEMQTLQIAVNAGIPLTTQLKRDGWSEDEITSMLADKKKEQAASRALGQQVLDTLRTQQDQQNPPVDNQKQNDNNPSNLPESQSQGV